MNLGRMRKLVTIEEPTEAIGAAGGPSRTWATYATVWAAFEPQRGASENLAADRLEARQGVNVRVRYLSGVTNQMRVVDDSRTLEIVSVTNPAERNAELVLDCVEVV